MDVTDIRAACGIISNAPKPRVGRRPDRRGHEGGGQVDQPVEGVLAGDLGELGAHRGRQQGGPRAPAASVGFGRAIGAWAWHQRVAVEVAAAERVCSVGALALVREEVVVLCDPRLVKLGDQGLDRARDGLLVGVVVGQAVPDEGLDRRPARVRPAREG